MLFFKFKWIFSEDCYMLLGLKSIIGLTGSKSSNRADPNPWNVGYKDTDERQTTFPLIALLLWG